jgi:VanZ family protein
VAYAAVLFALSSQARPLSFLPPELLAQDKVLHAIAYAALAALLVPGLRGAGLPARRALLAAIALASLYGVSDEIHQAFVPGRTADVLDWAADTAGAAVGAVVAGAALALRRPRGAG